MLGNRADLDHESETADGQVTPEEEFIHLLMASYRSMYAYARTMVPTSQDAEECVQEASLRLWQKFHEFNQEESFSRWARGFIRRVIKNFHRKKRPRYLAFDEDLIEKLTSTQGGAQELFELRREQLTSCLERLPLKDRTLIRDYYERGESVAMLSKVSGRSAAALHQALHRARLILFECIDRHLYRGD